MEANVFVFAEEPSIVQVNDIRSVQTQWGQTNLKFILNIYSDYWPSVKPLLNLKSHAIFIVLHSSLHRQTSRKSHRCHIYVCSYRRSTLTREMTFENVIFLFIASDGYKRRHVWMLQLTRELIWKVQFRVNVSISILENYTPNLSLLP